MIVIRIEAKPLGQAWPVYQHIRLLGKGSHFGRGIARTRYKCK